MPTDIPEFKIDRLISLLTGPEGTKRITRVGITVKHTRTIDLTLPFCVVEFAIISCDEALYNAERIVDCLNEAALHGVNDWKHAQDRDRDQR